MNNDTLRYAGFWPRLASLLLDALILAPIVMLVFWGQANFRLFRVYCFLPMVLLGLFYSVHLVRRHGGTPGKLIMGIRIRKLDGGPVGCKEAFLRYLPDFVLSALSSLALICPVLHMTGLEYQALTFTEINRRVIETAPSWHKPLQWIQTAWVWGELVVLLTNSRRRALHDFIAGTVVVRNTPKETKHPSGSHGLPAAPAPRP
ncbi:MAG: RDD family protein [Opitutaceae bacterium]|nr:RDD family protein [Opitutaceae bacterium]